MTLTGHIVGTKGNTGRGIASIVENADYTITINLTDGSSYTTAPIAGFTAVDFDENYDLVVTKTDGTTETVETDIEAFRTVLYGYKTDAETAESNASGYATAASGSASTATAKAKEAESYAKGGTSSRTGEDTDNADYYRGLAAASATAAGTSESNAGTQALKSEGYAVGKQNGTDVSSGSDYYHNNAKYYSDLASTAETNAGTSESNASASASSASADALKAEGYAVGKQNGTSVSSDSPYYHHNAMYYNSQATNMASLATNKANSAGTDALKAEGFSVGEQNGTPVTSDSDYYENNAKYYSEEAAASAASLVIEDALDEDSTNALENGVITKEFAKKANIDGAYESMTVGNAEQLVSTVFVNDEEPYNFRTAGGSADIGDRLYDTIVGGTVAWNQLARQGTNPITEGDVTFTQGDDGHTTTSGISTSSYFNFLSKCQIYSDHVYLNTSKVIKNPNNLSFDIGALNVYVYAPLGTSKILKANSTVNSSMGIQHSASGTNFAGLEFVYNLFDLTQMFGTTIADYIYSLEQATAGAGVAWFKKLFPKPYYAYNAGELISVNTSAHNTVGFNAWDEEWELGTIQSANGNNAVSSTDWRAKDYIPVLPNTSYHFHNGGVTNVFVKFYYDANKNYITYSFGNLDQGKEIDFTTPNGTYYMRFVMFEASTHYGLTYNNDICINLSWDGERDGEYEEYVKHSYPLDSSLTLRGIPKLDASNNLYYDGDVYESDGTVTRKYGVVDLGTLTWSKDTTDDKWGFYINNGILSNARVVASINELPHFVIAKYQPVVTSGHTQYTVNKVIYQKTNGQVFIVDDSYTDATTFKTAMSGVYLVYELATPTTESADPFQSPQIVDDFGTEEYVGSPIPVGHKTKYTNNLRAKLEMSPNSPDGAGDYLVRQTNGINEYVSLSSNATIQDMLARIEALEGGGE